MSSVSAEQLIRLAEIAAVILGVGGALLTYALIRGFKFTNDLVVNETINTGDF